MSVEIVGFRPKDDHEWKHWAACAKPGSPNMYPHDQDHRGIEAARAVCATCPVLTECLTAAVERGEQHGMWGGLTAGERSQLHRRAVRNKLDGPARQAAVLGAAWNAVDGAA